MPSDLSGRAGPYWSRFVTRLRCWWINHYAVPPDEPGGTRHYSMASHLREHGIDVLLVTSNVNYLIQRERSSQRNDMEILDRDGVCFARLKTPSYRGNSISKLWNMLSFKRRLRRCHRDFPGPKPDVIIGSTPHPFAADEARRIAGELGVPYVLEVRDLWPQTLIDAGGMSRVHPLVLWFARIERRVCRAAARVLTLLGESAEHFRRLGVPDERLVHVPNGIDADLLPAGRVVEEDGIFRVMFVGLHGMVYGLDTMIDAAKLTARRRPDRDVRFVLVGDGPEKSRLMQRVADEGIDNVEFRDSVAKSRIYDVMSEADAYVMQTRRCAMHQAGVSPNKVYDYMAMGRPVIFAVDGPTNPVSAAGSGLTIEPESPSALADAVMELASMGHEDRSRMGERGIGYVLEHHDLSKLAGRVAEALREVTGRSGAAAPHAG